MLLKKYMLLLAAMCVLSFAEAHSPVPADSLRATEKKDRSAYLMVSQQLTLSAANDLSALVRAKALELGKQVSVAVVDVNGQVVLINRGDGVGPHNSEASRRKAYTALSTKTATLLLAKNAKANPATENLAHLPELLLLGGGVPLYYQGNVIGAIGVSGGGGPENDDLIARAAQLLEFELVAK
ncbi:heme-binding protein [Sphingobacterium faecium]|uniref:heme-binding protein n=1 Tax=Sphingobacterium faecium TaxID=34087 RepID=UPI002479DFE5|nr:heme-binding protein [Sphingobacterium faecium]WGQ12954.1 heme-binding protein [Sphingobacterium faecium]